MARQKLFLLPLLTALLAVPGHCLAQHAACESGQAALQDRLFVTALSYLTKCLETGDLSIRNRAVVLHMRAAAFAGSGDSLRASNDYRHSLAFKPPEIAWDLIPLGIYLREAARYDESLEVLRRCLDLDEDGPGSGPGVAVYFHLGWTLHELRRFAEAIDTYAQGIAKQPGFEGIYLRRALSHEAMGEREKARADLVKIIGIGAQRGLAPATAPDEYKSKFVEYGLIPDELRPPR